MEAYYVCHYIGIELAINSHRKKPMQYTFLFTVSLCIKKAQQTMLSFTVKNK